MFENEGFNGSKWGPVVAPQHTAMGDLIAVNQGGCLELTEPCNAACAAAFEGDMQCEAAACGASCSASESSGDFTDYENCAFAADSCDPNGCFTYEADSNCWLSITGPGTVCFTGFDAATGAVDFETNFVAVAGVFCAE